MKGRLAPEWLLVLHTSLNLFDVYLLEEIEDLIKVLKTNIGKAGILGCFGDCRKVLAVWGSEVRVILGGIRA